MNFIKTPFFLLSLLCTILAMESGQHPGQSQAPTSSSSEELRAPSANRRRTATFQQGLPSSQRFAPLSTQQPSASHQRLQVPLPSTSVGGSVRPSGRGQQPSGTFGPSGSISRPAHKKSKKLTTTYNVDATNFRDMVEHFTGGVLSAHLQHPSASIPVPSRPIPRYTSYQAPRLQMQEFASSHPLPSHPIPSHHYTSYQAPRQQMHEFASSHPLPSHPIPSHHYTSYQTPRQQMQELDDDTMRSLLADKEESTSWINHLNGLPEQNIAITELKNKYAERIARINALVTRSTASGTGLGHFNTMGAGASAIQPFGSGGTGPSSYVHQDPANMLIPSPSSMVGPDAQEEEDLSKMLAVLQEQFGQGDTNQMASPSYEPSDHLVISQSPHRHLSGSPSGYLTGFDPSQILTQPTETVPPSGSLRSTPVYAPLHFDQSPAGFEQRSRSPPSTQMSPSQSARNIAVVAPPSASRQSIDSQRDSARQRGQIPGSPSSDIMSIVREIGQQYAEPSSFQIAPSSHSVQTMPSGQLTAGGGSPSQMLHQPRDAPSSAVPGHASGSHSQPILISSPSDQIEAHRSMGTVAGSSLFPVRYDQPIVVRTTPDTFQSVVQQLTSRQPHMPSHAHQMITRNSPHLSSQLPSHQTAINAAAGAASPYHLRQPSLGAVHFQPPSLSARISSGNSAISPSNAARQTHLQSPMRDRSLQAHVAAIAAQGASGRNPNPTNTGPSAAVAPSSPSSSAGRDSTET